jgi:hypothetical protein
MKITEAVCDHRRKSHQAAKRYILWRRPDPGPIFSMINPLVLFLPDTVDTARWARSQTRVLSSVPSGVVVADIAGRGPGRAIVAANKDAITPNGIRV